MRRILAIVLPVLTFALACGVLEWIVRAGYVADYVLPRPSDVWAVLREPGTDLWAGPPDAIEYGGVLSTAIDALFGFGCSVLIGGLLAVVLASSRWAKLAFYPYAVFFQTVPIIAIAPMLVVWLDFGSPTVRAAACIASIFPVIANTYAGLASTDPALRDLFKLHGAGWVATTFKLRLPMALPYVFTGLRISAGLAVIGAIIGEIIGGGGLATIIESAKTQQRIDKVFAAVLLASLLGLAMVCAINLLSWLTLRHWHASARGEEN